MFVCILQLSVDFNESCTVQPLQTHKVCTVSLQGRNGYFQNDTVPGVVSLGQNSSSFCNQTHRDVIMYKRKCS